ncbi:outer membrane protein assembly factor BamB [Lysobacter pythonis]|uniref:Outer membrane protein assembly factor BamB n=1 Tax=Solilutibacter pythonis TaxID=2483112 RepID=A0A3M2I8P1_9GAMM|nr:outer membrane protein assembly factor BamB [Lysobacter pythonis]RMH94847.1 outer membrane protein assembly factor BamB [Lysobacter pythonis]
MYRNRTLFQVTGLLACAIALSGCTTVKGWFGSKNDKANKPAELVDFTPTASPQRLWTVGLGKGEGRSGARQRPVVAGGKVYAGGGDSGVRAIDLQSGQTLWTWNGEKKSRWVGGPGVGEGLVVAGSLDGEVVALDEASGAERWKATVQNEVIAAPAVGGGLVFVRSNDGRVTAFDAANGSRRWSWRADMPALTVRGNAGLTLGPGYLFVGNDNGRVTALSSADGSELWEATVAQPEGRSELDRMNDVDGQPVLDDTLLYVSSFKPRTMAIEAPTGRVLWLQENGGVGGVGLGGSRLAVTDAKDVVWALDRSGGAPMWQQPAFVRRSVTAPAVQDEYVVVGDYDGYLHWLRMEDGKIAARARVSRKRVRAQPVVADGILLVQDVAGNLAAYRLGQ